MAYTLHWQTTSDPTEQVSVHADYAAGLAAEVAKALEFAVSEFWFKLWLDNGSTIIHLSEKSI